MSNEVVKEERFALFNTQFSFGDKQELILLSNCHGTASSVTTSLALN